MFDSFCKQITGSDHPMWHVAPYDSTFQISCDPCDIPNVDLESKEVEEEAKEVKEKTKKCKADDADEEELPKSKLPKSKLQCPRNPPCGYCCQFDGTDESDDSEDSSDSEDSDRAEYPNQHWVPRLGMPWAQKEPASTLIVWLG